MRECRIQTPVIFLTVLSDEIYEEAALKWGAVDFIDKSRRLPIILQRLKLITEGVKPSVEGGGQTPAVIRNGPLALKTDIRRAFWARNQVALTLTEVAIVLFPVSQQGAHVPYPPTYN